MMNTYFVKLAIQAGGYEKKTAKLVKAINEFQASEQALLGECHGSIEDATAEWTDKGIEDLAGEFHYSVIHCMKVQPEHVEVLRSYFEDVFYVHS